MDILSTKGMTPEEIKVVIAMTEARWPTLVADNARIRTWWEDGDNAERLLAKFPDFDINAAYISDDRSDRLNCGKCLFYRLARKINGDQPL